MKRGITLFSSVALVACSVRAVTAPEPVAVPQLQLEQIVDERADGTIERGTFTVWENREAKDGRTLDLQVVVLRALATQPQAEPVFVFDGGPGLAAARGWQRFADHWMRAKRDIVLVNQRGTGGANRLDCDGPGGPGDLQGYLDPVFSDAAAFRACLEQLRERADLRWYGTATAMDDLDDLRRALGFDRINVMGGSYGSRAALEYVRRHGEHVRCAIVNGVAPVAFINPLYHAWSAQRAVDRILDECAADPDCANAYPNLRKKFETVLARLEREPAAVTVHEASTGRPIELTLTRDAFAEALRILMYYDSRHIPHHINSAFEGDYKTFAITGFKSNRAIRDAVAFGMLLCVTCSEDIPRIDRERIDELTDGTFLRDVRVRQQMAICEFWPTSHVPADHGEPLRSDVPVLMLSGQYDPVTPPKFAADAARFLPNSVHVVAPGSHGVGGPCIESITRDFLERGSGDGLDTGCVEQMSAGPFFIETRAAQRQ